MKTFKEYVNVSEKVDVEEDMKSIKKVLKTEDVTYIKMNNWFEGKLTDGRPFIAGRSNRYLEADIFKNIKDLEDNEPEDTKFISK